MGFKSPSMKKCHIMMVNNRFWMPVMWQKDSTKQLWQQHTIATQSYRHVKYHKSSLHSIFFSLSSYIRPIHSHHHHHPLPVFTSTSLLQSSLINIVQKPWTQFTTMQESNPHHQFVTLGWDSLIISLWLGGNNHSPTCSYRKMSTYFHIHNLMLWQLLS